ncbi:glycosyltransferase [Chelatococcus reniformis]|uniref:glycosyltransferase n=1 Tax=Chelatococcus reniformis TaxID=1494448 RepID=UPI001FCE5EB5|nr:glycosyltransferase [Chelatococcus reniformis]
MMFILPVAGESGGAHSVMQEADAMARLGVPVAIAVDQVNAERLRAAYDDLPLIAGQIVGFGGAHDLASLIAQRAPSVVVATTNESVHTIAAAVTGAGGPGRTKFAYYIQDYEPFFHDQGSDDWLAAHASYGLIPGMTHFAKTRWLQEVVEANHKVPVRKVEASIDHTVYFPDLAARARARDRFIVAGMIRPWTPRRAPRRTARLLNQVAETLGENVSCLSFGCEAQSLRASSLALNGVQHVGVLRRHEVGELFRGVDLFLDLSDYQAFGRTALEAMSCGCLAVVPAHGGAYEFASHGRNGFIVDTRRDADILQAVEAFLGLSGPDRGSMIMNAVATGYRYSAERAALSEIELFLSL